MADARSQIGEALDGKLDAEQLRILMDEILAITKTARGWCPSCNRAVIVQVADAKAVTGALTELMNQSWGRPEVASSGDEGVTFVRKVVYGSEGVDDEGRD